MTATERTNANELGTRMRGLRHRLSMTLQQLGTASGVSVGYLSQLERGNATPTLGTLSQIAAALGVAVDFFIVKPRAVDSLTRAGSRAKFGVEGTSVQYEQIGANFPGNELTSFVMNVPAGYSSEVVTHVGEEIIYVLEGQITQMVGGREYVMTTGDSLHYQGETPHCWSNNTDTPARIFWVGRMQYEKPVNLSNTPDGASNGSPEIVPLRP